MLLHFNSIVTGIMSVPISPLAHISTSDSRPLLSNVVDYTCAICPRVTAKTTAAAAARRLTFVCSSQRLFSPVEELQISVVEDADAGDYNQSRISADSSGNRCSNDTGDEAVGVGDSLEPLSKKVLKERIRRMRIGLANKGKVPWNKGRKHTAETRERIRQRTLEALRDPKVRKKMAEHPRFHSDQIKAKISYSTRRVWQERLKSKRLGENFFLSWEQSIANAARKGVSGQEELDWDSYSRILQQLEFHQLLQAEVKEKIKLMAISGAKRFIQSWRESIAKAAKKGWSGEQELDWGSYKNIQKDMVLVYQLQCTAEKVKAKEMARVKAQKAARIKAIRKVMLTQKRKGSQEKTKGRGDIKIRQHRKAKEGKGYLEVNQEFKLVSKLTKIQVNKRMSNEVGREGKVFNSILPTYSKLDIELIKREKMQKEVSLADQIKAARDKRAELH